MQCLESDPKDLVEMIRNQVNPGAAPNYGGGAGNNDNDMGRKDSLDNNWMMSEAESVANHPSRGTYSSTELIVRNSFRHYI